MMAYKIRYNVAFGFVWFLILIHDSNAFNLRLISRDLKRNLKPLIIKKNSHHFPVTINIKSGIPKLPATIPPVLKPKLSKNPFPIKLKANKKPLNTKPLRLRKLTKLPKLRKASKLTKTPKLPKISKLPKIPKLPILPLLPPLIPKLPILPLLSVLPPLPLLLPMLPKLPKLRKPLGIPLITKIDLKALGSEMRPVTVPAPNLKRRILEKLLKLRRDGSLTTAEFIRFKKLLL